VRWYSESIRPGHLALGDSSKKIPQPLGTAIAAALHVDPYGRSDAAGGAYSMRRKWLAARMVVFGATLLPGCRDAPLVVAVAEPREPTVTTAARTGGGAPLQRESISLVPEFPRAAGGPFPFGAEDLAPWRDRVPRIEVVSIPSSADGSAQRALFYDPGRSEPRPLLVALHSWSENYLQNIGIPYGVFAQRNGWILVHPDHRGPYRRPEAAASELSQKDVLDAVEYAKKRANVDTSRIYLVGYSGSAMTSLVLAGKHPDTWAGVVAWVPIYDLGDWYDFVRRQLPDRHYAQDVAAACGGPPVSGTTAAAECRRRSPSTWLSGARGKVNVYLGLGIWDQLVPPRHALRAWNDLADPADRVADEHIRKLDETRRIPDALGSPSARPLYDTAGAKALFERTSLRATVVIFQGGHDVIYNAGLAWLSDKRRD
jgi:hypothetical protein